MFTKSTKRGTVVASVVSLVLCFVMLLGTTFAWFSTSVSSTVNTVKSGSLKIDLVNAEGKSLVGKTIAFADGEAKLWEPGCEYALESVKVKNTGNIAVKYEIKVVDISGDAALMDVITFEDNANGLTGTLAADAETAAINIVGKMDEAAGNQYQNLTADGIAVVVYATQAAAGDDAFEKVSVSVKELDVATIENCDVALDTAYSFSPAEADAKYATWHADYVVWVDQDIAANEITLAGQYDNWDENWVCYENEAPVKANQEIRLIKDYMNGYPWTYGDAVNYVKEFNCGAASDVAGLTLNVQLRLFEVVDCNETGNYAVAGTYSYTF